MQAWDMRRLFEDPPMTPIEAAARAISDADAEHDEAEDPSMYWETLTASSKDEYRRHATAAIAAYTKAVSVEAVAWESTTSVYIKYLTQERYSKLSPDFQKWYKPYKCSSCSTPPLPAVPDGWKLVPVEPTKNMIDATAPAHEGEAIIAKVMYRAMLAAAPEPEEK